MLALSICRVFFLPSLLSGLYDFALLKKSSSITRIRECRVGDVDRSLVELELEEDGVPLGEPMEAAFFAPMRRDRGLGLG